MTPRRRPASGSVFCGSWRRTASRWWPRTCRSRPSAMWRSTATSSVGCRAPGNTDRLLGPAPNTTLLSPNQRATTMSTITTKDGTEIYYKDWGTGPLVTFSHGWPLNSDAWDGQMLFLAQHGYRCLGVDRRGHG